MAAPSSAPNRDREECVLYGAVAGIGTVPVVIALAQGVPFGAEATIGLMMAIVGVAGLVVRWRIGIPHSS